VYGIANQLSGSPSIPGAPLDAALGLLRAVVREKRWLAWLELGVSGPIFLIGLGTLAIALVGALAPESLPPSVKVPGNWPVGFVLLVIGPIAAVDGWRRLKRISCVIVAELGFDDRSGKEPAGPVLWSEVETISPERMFRVGPGGTIIHAEAVNALVIRLAGLPRAPLSSLGPPPRQIEEIRIILDDLEGGRSRLPALMKESFVRWANDQAYRQTGRWPESDPPQFGFGQSGRPPGRLFRSVFGFWDPGSSGPDSPFGSTPGVVWADMTSRIRALLIDLGVVLLGLCFVFMVEGIYGPNTPETETAAGVWMISAVMYQPIFWWIFRGSIGHHLAGLRVVRAADGRRLGIGRTLIRYLVWVVGLPLVLFGVSDTFAGDDPRPHTMWDRAARSAVVRERPAPALLVVAAALVALVAVICGVFGLMAYAGRTSGPTAPATSPSAPATSPSAPAATLTPVGQPSSGCSVQPASPLTMSPAPACATSVPAASAAASR
jgi:hypothetical protein